MLHLIIVISSYWQEYGFKFYWKAILLIFDYSLSWLSYNVKKHRQKQHSWDEYTYIDYVS